ncbi:MAG: hypothetical protein C4523_13980 [Myxococcales bacterium]|nr:MAG: hypothetical protein C4523_13980 [Myxococcales bacterium]
MSVRRHIEVDCCASGGAACAESEMRCDCGCLLACLKDGMIELKCRRCKRTVLLRVEAADGSGASGAGCPGSPRFLRS